MIKLYKLLTFFLFCGFISCGIEEYYYLPQVPASNITEHFNTEAEIIIPSINQTEFYYFTNYAIYYKLYTGESPYIDTGFNADLRSDYNAIFPYTDPINLSGTSIESIFTSRNYNELLFEGESSNSMLPFSGGILTIVFPTAPGEQPYASLRDTPRTNIYLNRSINDPSPDRSLLNSPELRTNERNTDVSRRGGNEVYCSMYIVAKGNDNRVFRSIFSKPTHINIFKLPEQ